MDIKQQLEKHGFEPNHFREDVYEGKLSAFESLLAEHLMLSSAEAIYQLGIGTIESGVKWLDMEKEDYEKTLTLSPSEHLRNRIVYEANPINQVLLDSHKRLEEAANEMLQYEGIRANNQGDCNCMFYNMEYESLYETGKCPHQLARKALAKAKGIA